MRPSLSRPYAILTFLLAATLVVCLWFGEATEDEAPLFRMDLPTTVGAWTGADLFYCQSASCARVWVRQSVVDNPQCRYCGGPVGPVSAQERNILPPDTRIFRKEYHREDGRRLMVSVVVTGTHRWSLHRPQWCLPGQGYSIESEHLQTISDASEQSFAVSRIHGHLSVRGPSSPQASQELTYFYWYMSGDRESPDYNRVLFWMAWDSLIRGLRRPWAYVTVLIPEDVRSPADTTMMAEFIAAVHTHLVSLHPSVHP